MVSTRKKEVGTRRKKKTEPRRGRIYSIPYTITPLFVCGKQEDTKEQKKTKKLLSCDGVVSCAYFIVRTAKRKTQRASEQENRRAAAEERIPLRSRELPGDGFRRERRGSRSIVAVYLAFPVFFSPRRP